MRTVFAVDIGGTKIAVGIVDEAGTVLARETAPTPAGDPEAIVALSLRMAASLECAGCPVPEALGLALPGVLDESRRVLVRSPSSGLYDVPFVSLFSGAFRLPAIAENDVNACAVAESVFGAARGMDSFFWMTVSTGVGGAFFCGGSLVRGRDGMAGEIGHLVVRPGGAPCACGNRGCLEAEAAGPAWPRHLQTLMDIDPARTKPRTGPGGTGGGPEPYVAPASDARAIAQRARSGDTRCLAVVDTVAEALARGMAAVVAIVDPGAIFLGGGVSGAADLLLPRILDRMPDLVLGRGIRRIHLVPSALGSDAALAGAAACAFGIDREGEPRWDGTSRRR